jgi:hypothetical protein
LERIQAETGNGGNYHLKALIKVKSYIVGPDTAAWPALEMRLSAQIPGRHRFPNRDALEHFCKAVEVESGGRATLTVGVIDAYNSAGTENVEDVFRLTSGKIWILVITTPNGSLSIDNRKRRSTTTISASATTLESVRATEQLANQAKRFLQPVPAWRRLVRTPVVTEVAAHEIRDNRWKMTVGLVSSLLGAVAGFLAGLVSGGLLGPGSGT